MSAKILSGIKIRDEKIVELKDKFQSIKLVPELSIIQIGNRLDSTSYINAKISFAKKINVKVSLLHFPENILESDLVLEIQKSNKDKNIKGIIVQLPIPKNFDVNRIINTIDPKKDIDGLTDTNRKLLLENDPKAVIPATARGVLELLEYYKVNVIGKKVTVVGRSDLVGKPIAQLLSNKGAIVTVAHSKTIDLVKETKNADIIIVAVGKVGLITSENVKSGQTIVDVGINKSGDLDVSTNKTKIVGDIDFDQVKNIVQAITPVPGGVGPMTVLALFENLLDCVKRN